MDKTFSIYRSSAGSGKTRTLAKEYLKLALRYPEYFRYILAMTFTNKSTQEMKDRIIRYLDDFAEGKSEDLAAEIIADYQQEGRTVTSDQLKDSSHKVLTLILHQYSQFSVSTIDAFFQRVIRSFTRETGLLGNFRLEVENDLVVEEVVGLLMDQLTSNEELLGWIMEYSMEQLKNGKDWDIRSTLMVFSKEIFREEFKEIEEQVLEVTAQKEFFREFKNRLQQEAKTFENTIRQKARGLLDAFHANQLTVEDFLYGRAGSVYTYVDKLSRGEIELPGSRILAALDDADKWAGPKSDKKLIRFLVVGGWQSQLLTLVDYLQKNFVVYESVRQALRNLYVFGLVSDISRTLKEYLSDNNLMLLSDAPHFLQGVMKDQDTSFVYEKVGSFYRHFLIDEFQDTSGFQWKNLLPLIKNGLAQNYKSLIVGDIKQSIYRWRGGDLNILQEKVKDDVGESVVDIFPLDSNYRSLGNLVSFNNALFASAAESIGNETNTNFPTLSYVDAEQKIFRDKTQGYVRIQFVEAELDDAGKKKTFEELSLERLPKIMEDLQLKGIPLRDIAFLVRENSEGQKIAKYFMEYGASPEALSDCRYDVVSNESLRLDQASSVLILINAMRILENPENMIAHAHLAYEYQKLWPANTFPEHHTLFTQSRTKLFAKLVPKAFTEQLEILSAFPLIELIENLIHIFSLGKLPAEIPYLQAFEDVIFEFAIREKSDLASFLIWWEDNKHKKSIQVAGGVEASQIITIHKSKGLQFRYVIIPFLNWELNHGTKAPILWCKSDNPLFADAGYLPIRYTSALEDSFFKDTYQKERERIFMDNLNLLYVAFTRAEEGMIAQAPLPSAKAPLTHVGNLVWRVIADTIKLLENWNKADQRFEVGQVVRTNVEKGNPQKALSLRQYTVTPWRDRIHVRMQGKEFFQVTEQRKKINYGIFLHTLMSRVRTAGDIPSVMKQSLQEGLIMPDEKNQIEESIRWIVSNPDLKDAFADGGIVKTEASLIIPGGGERRIDRILINNGAAILIDYKTGKPKSEDKVQVREYMNILLSMGISSIRGFLVYPAERNCVEV